MTKTLPISEARQSLTSLVAKVGKQMARFIITCKGKPLAVLISHKELESWQETLDVIADAEEIAGICEGLGQLLRGESVPFEEVFGEPLSGHKAKTGHAL